LRPRPRSTRPTGPDGTPSSSSAWPHTTCVGCVYIKDLDLVDLSVLEDIIARSFRSITTTPYRLRAREGGQAGPTDA